ncbi:MAG TPA: Rrf2 family transcriptional regulator [Pyrinomonadaceae bacterium]|nr:Rrf2 family transcriptional regulator [Pyrinomonadaceae bacterium]
MSTSSRFSVAVHVLALMASAGGELVKSEHVAYSVNTNPVVIRRILCALARAGLVVSQTGAAGGSRLARPPADITLREVYRAVEPQDVFSLHRQPPNRKCPVGMNIELVLEDVLKNVDAAIDDVLAGITVDGVLESLKPCARGVRKRRR